MAEPIRVVLTGAAGRMGREVVRAIAGTHDIALVGAVAPGHAGLDIGTLAGLSASGLATSEDLGATLQATKPDVLVDFSTPRAVYANAQAAMAAGVRPVIGATGLAANEVTALSQAAEARGLGALVAPNFAIGALLMIQFAKTAARYFDHAELIELHHNQKLDAPSGTALKTIEAMREAQPRFGASNGPETESLPGARGAELGGIHLHSVRLPGLLAHQEVLFGGLGQVLTIKHDATSRECYMPGVLLGIRKVMGLTGLVYGLEHLL